MRPALDAVEKHWRERWRKAWEAGDREGGRGALIIVGRRDQDKFFSNGPYNFTASRRGLNMICSGLDYENVRQDSNFFPSSNTTASITISY
jgi:hypothetical protein